MNNFNTISTMQWAGLQSQRFRGSRSHAYVPQDQLDFKLSSKKSDYKSTGRKYLQPLPSQSSQEPFKKHMRTYDDCYKSQIVNFPLQPKLIKLYGLDDSKREPKDLNITMNPKKQVWETLGMSKMKALENGQKKTGIYRNFYKSIQNSTLKPQSKSSDFLSSKKLYSSIDRSSNEFL